MFATVTVQNNGVYRTFCVRFGAPVAAALASLGAATINTNDREMNDHALFY